MGVLWGRSTAEHLSLPWLDEPFGHTCGTHRTVEPPSGCRTPSSSAPTYTDTGMLGEVTEPHPVVEFGLS